MIHKAKIFIGLLLSTTSQVQAEMLTVEVHNILVNKGGSLMVLLFDGEGFPIKHEQAVAIQRLPVTSNRMLFQFEKPNAKYIAFKVLHDEDGNEKVTKNWTGIWPREGLGFSNKQKMGAFGPPSFSMSKLSTLNVIDKVTLSVDYP